MSKRAPIIAGVAALLAIILVYLFLVSPRQKLIATKTEQYDVAVAQQSALQQQLVALEQLQEQTPEFQRQLNQNELLIPKQADTPGLIRTLSAVADNDGVDFAVLSQGTPAPAAGFSSISIALTVSGTLPQVARYLYDLENLDRAVKMLDINLTPEIGTTKVTLTGNALIFTTDIASGPGSQPGSQEVVAAPPATGETAPDAQGAAEGAAAEADGAPVAEAADTTATEP